MRKNFLLLFLMALLPLAGWAAEYSVYVNAKAISIKYGVATPAVNADMFTANTVGTGAGVSGDVKTAIAGKLSLSTAREIDSPVSGSYTFTLALTSTTDATVHVSGDDYTILMQEATNSLVVTKGDGAVVDVAPTLVADDLKYNNTDQVLLATSGSGKINGTTITGLPLEYSVNGGDWNSTLPTGKDVNSYVVSYRVKETDNYAASASANLSSKSIAKGTPTISVAPVKTSDWTYDGVLHHLLTTAATTDFGTVKYSVQYKAIGAASYGTWGTGRTSIDHGDFNVRKAGQYKIKWFIEADENCNAVNPDERLIITVSRATLKPSIKAGQSKEYGDDDPTTYEAEYVGFQNGETAATAAGFTAPTMARAAGENAGVYAITMNEDGAADNYIFDYSLATPVNFSITAKAFTDETGTPFTFTVANASKTYTGSAVTNSLSVAKFKTTNLVNNTDYTIEYKDNVNVGTATMTIKGKGNFKGSVNRTFEITAGEIYIIPTAATKEYGKADPSFDYTLKVGSATVAKSNLHGTVELARVAGENVGTYKIYVKSYTAGSTADNYIVQNTMNDPTSADDNNKTANFTITPSTKTLALKFKNTAIAKKTYGDNNPEWSINDLEVVSGLADADDWDAIKTSLGTPDFAIASENVADNATNQVTVSSLVSPAYPTVTVEPMAFTIDAREIAVKVKDQDITYGDDIVKDDPADTYWTITTASWNGNTTDTKADLTLRLSTVNGIGTYAPGSETADAIVATISNNSNYILKEADCEWGKLTVGGVTPSSVLAMNSDFDNDNDDYTTIIQAYDTKTVTVKITVDRTQTVKNSTLEYTWKGEDWNAFILPFAITPRELSEAFGYAIVNVVNPEKTKDGNVAFKLNMSEEIPANTPFMLKNYTAVAEDAVIDFGERKIEAPTSELSIPAGEGIQFIGSYKTKVIDKDMPNAYFYNGEGAWKHFGTTSDKSWKIAPFNAYMLMPATGGAREYTFTFEEPDGSTTAIRSISEDATTTIAKGWYTLNGVKMQNAPTQKGVYIKDGKKVVIK